MNSLVYQQICHNRALKNLEDYEAIRAKYRKPEVVVINQQAPVVSTGQSDLVLRCQDCGSNFVFSVGEQKFYASKGFTYPCRCKYCRKIRKNNK